MIVSLVLEPRFSALGGQDYGRDVILGAETPYGGGMMAHSGTHALEWLSKHQETLEKLSDEIWYLAELGLHENKSARAQEALLGEFGFMIESGVADMPSAFVATWGRGRPTIGFLGEYDALPGCSNEPVPIRKEIIPEGPGHACGHNLLGVAALAAAIAVKEELSRSGVAATVKYFGCPAEENFGGKAFMARAGYYDSVDACLTWHPGAVNTVRGSSSLAVNSMNVHFHGRTAHAAGAPHHGRSALDAAEIMNIGANYLREHVTDRTRIHYVITNGGRQPNVVPAEATVWYYVRAPRRDEVDDVYARVLKCAEGAAIMTGTTYDVKLLDALYDVLPNRALEDVLARAMDKAGPPEFSKEDFGFGEEISKTFPPGQREAILREDDYPAEVRRQVHNTTLVPRPATERPPRGSTDVGDVSWCVPTAQFSAACWALGTAGHSWQVTAQSGMSIGHAGMIAAARTLALAGLDLIDHPEAIARAWEEFNAKTEGKKYRCAIPDDIKPPLHQLDPNRKR
jgi:aminobenzoyl-glutamate utilization protein B